MSKKYFYLMAILLTLTSCGDNSDTDSLPGPINDSGYTTSDWLVPIAEVKDGGPGKDGIPSIDNPQFLNALDFEIDYLEDDDLVIGVVRGNEVKAYPHLIMDWHEVVNDAFNDEFVTVSYCPLTGTAFGWKSAVNGGKSTFGVSGLLYNANLIMYDRSTNSNWSQLGLKCINGELISSRPEFIGVVETNWKTWRNMYPHTKVMTLATGFSRNYGFYPYGSYNTNNDYFIFPASPTNNSLPSKERVYAIIDDPISKVYRFPDFSNGRVVKETFNGSQYVIVGNKNVLCSFQLSNDQTNLTFEYTFNNSEEFFKDDEGNKWSIFGVALEGPRIGEVMVKSKSVVSYWFAIAAFYPNPEIF